MYIGSIEYVLGEKRKICTEELLDAAKVQAVMLGGLQFYRKSSSSPEKLAMTAISKCLAKTSVNKNGIKAVVYATTMDTVTMNGRFDYKYIEANMHSFDLSGAYPFGVFLSQCANIISALRFARNTIIAENIDSVIIVTTDVIPETSSRFMKDDLSILSDGASACIVSRHPLEYKIDNITQSINYSLDNIANPLSATFARANEIGKITRQHFVNEREAACLLKQIFTNNYNIPTMKFYAQQFTNEMGEGAFDKIYMKNVRENGHAFSSDTLINLKDYSDDGKLSLGDQVLLCATGQNRWGMVTLTVAK